LFEIVRYYKAVCREAALHLFVKQAH
jgi:hypothetical protein